MFALFSPHRERRVIDAGRVCCPLRRRDVEVDLCAGCGWASEIDTQADAPFVRCRAELVRSLPDLFLI